MAQQNMELALRAVDAWNGDVEASTALWDAEGHRLRPMHPTTENR